MRIINRPDLPRHRFTGADPEARPSWGPVQTGQADALLRTLVQQCFPRGQVRKLLIAGPCEQPQEVCMELDIFDLDQFAQGFPEDHRERAAQHRRRAALFSRLALALLKPADYRLWRGACFIHRSYWKMDDKTAHEQIEGISLLNQALADAGPEVRFFHRALLKAADQQAA